MPGRLLKIEPRKFGKYLLLDRIGVGGMAEIFRARQFGAAGFQKQLAVKKILRHLADNDEFVRMFIDEAKIAVSLQHANIVQIYDLGSVAREYFIAMEYVVGKDLLALLIRCTALRIRVPHKLAVYIVAEALKGLEAAHSAMDGRGRPLGIIHRDVSPSNLLLSYDGEVKLGDFGVARAAFRDGHSRAGAMKGKLGYMSPEQVTGKTIDQRSDVFSAGIMLYEMLAMNRLFSGKTELETMMAVRDCDVGAALERLPPGVPDGLRPVLQRALAKAPEARFQTATQFLDALLDHLFHEKIRVTGQDMGRFMKSVFAKELEEERAQRAEVDHMVQGAMAELARSQTPFPTVRRSITGHTAQPRAAEWIPDSPAAWTPRSKMRIRDTAGVVFGPMGINTFVEIVQRQGLADGEEISIDASEWMDAREIPELIEGIEALARSGKAKADYQGRFGKMDFPRLLYRYAVTQATGRMHLSSGSKRKEIFWRNGRPEYVTSNLSSELLGEFLVERRIIPREQLNKALANLADFEGRLGDALLHQGVLSPHDLFTALSAQVKAKLLEVFSWDDGEYRFYRDEQTAAQIVPLGLSAWRLINEGVLKRMSTSEVRGFFANRLNRPILRLEHKLLDVSELHLSKPQARIWQAVGHGCSIQSQMGRLLAIPGADERRVWRLLFLMERLDFIRIAEKGSP
jgi:serine/threonine-protein kinase